MAVKGTALATTAQFETRHGVASGVDTTLIEQVIDAATRWIEGQCDRKLKARNYNGFGTAFDQVLTGTADTVPSEDYVYLNGDVTVRGSHGAGVFFLPAYPIIEPSEGGTKTRITHKNGITFVLQELLDRAADTWTTLTKGVDYYLEPERGIIRLIGWFPETGHRNYRVTATLGLCDAAAAPYVEDDLRDLCLYIAGKLYREEMDKASDRQGSSSSELVALKDDHYVMDLVAQYARL